MKSLNYAKMYKRILKDSIKQHLFKGKAIIITGARQTGKTTLSFEIINEIIAEKAPVNIKTQIFNGDNPTDRNYLANRDLEFLIKLVESAEIIFIDEAQKIQNIGQTIKLLVDHYKQAKQIIITGSSSINLLDSTQEALTGRKYTYQLFPLSLEEIYPEKNLLTILKELEFYLVFGSYPEVVTQKTIFEKRDLLKELCASYLYKDVLEFQLIKNSEVITKLLKALALQIGSEVSYTELSKMLEIDKKTVEKYIDLLEKNYVIFKISAYSSNKRREISKSKKIYFYDLGIRNAVIDNFNLLNDRADTGAIWENFMMIERLKYRSYHKIFAQAYFWRTYDGSEIDLIEEREGKLWTYEFKWGKQGIKVLHPKKLKPPSSWIQAYGQTPFAVITPQNLSGFILGGGDRIRTDA